jgi:hypothetical protein
MNYTGSQNLLYIKVLKEVFSSENNKLTNNKHILAFQIFPEDNGKKSTMEFNLIKYTEMLICTYD